MRNPLILLGIFFLFNSCKNHYEQKLYYSEYRNLIILLSKNKIEGFTIHPNFNKYSCNIYFRGNISQSGFDTANVYINFNEDSMIKISESTFKFKLNKDELIVSYSTDNIGCASWIFINSNEYNLLDTFKLIEVERKGYFQIALLNDYDVNTQNNFAIILDTNYYKSIITGWEYNRFVMRDTLLNDTMFTYMNQLISD